MKKFLFLILTLVCIVFAFASLSACTGENKTPENTTVSSETSLSGQTMQSESSEQSSEAQHQIYTVYFDFGGAEDSEQYARSKQVTEIKKEDFVFGLKKQNVNFRGWEYNDTLVYDEFGNELATVNIQDDMCFVAKFVQSAKLTVITNIPEAGTFSDTRECDYYSYVDIFAHPYQGYNFVGWYNIDNQSLQYDVLIATQQDYRFLMWTEDTTIMAKFEIAWFDLTIYSNNADLGLVYDTSNTNRIPVERSILKHAYLSQTTITAITDTDTYRFLGWYDTDNNLVSPNAVYTFTMVNYDYTIEAKWNRFSISYELDGGTQNQNNPTLYSIEDTKDLYIPTKQGYTFTGWDYNGQIITQIDGSIAKHITLTAIWTYYTLTTLVNDENAGSVTSFDQTKITAGEQVTITAQTNAGYTFIGWFDGDTKLAESLSYTFAMPNKSVIYTAKWCKVTLSVNDINAGTVTNLNGEYTSGQQVTITAQTNAGYTFVGWFNGETKLTESLSYTFEMPMQDLTYTAKWTYYTLTTTVNDENAGMVTSYNQTKITVGEQVTLTAQTNAGYTFIGWFNGETKLTESLSYSFEMPTQDLTYTAKWVYYTLTTARNNSNAGTVTCYNQTKITAGEQVTVTAQTNAGYTFVGWFDGDTKLTESLSYTFAMPTQDLTYTAKWEIIEYTATFMVGEDVIGERTFTIEDATIANTPEIPDKAGYTAEWDYEWDYVIQPKDIVINAVYSIINYGVTYYLNGGTQNVNNPTQFTVEDVFALYAPTKQTTENTSYETLSNGNYNVTVETTTYEFFGWYKEATFINKVEEISLGTVGALTLYAKWSESTTTTTSTVQVYSRESNYIYFGAYPQTDVTSSMGSSLASYVATKPTNGNNNGWTSYKYYISSSNSTDFMWYKDITHTDGNKYRAIYFTSYRPYFTSSSTGTDNTYQDDNGYNTSNVYWFRYDAIKWRILEETNGKAKILAELMLDSQDYNYTISSRTMDGKTVYGNNYKYSSIRAWLNETFYNTAFTNLQKGIINTVTVDNSARSTNPDNNATQWNSGNNSYACENTQDKVWLLSQQEVTMASYGFDTATGQSNTRQKAPSAYAKCQGVYVNSGNGFGSWWLRSPYCNDDSHSHGVDDDGYSLRHTYVYGTDLGVVPALQITL